MLPLYGLDKFINQPIIIIIFKRWVSVANISTITLCWDVLLDLLSFLKTKGRYGVATVCVVPICLGERRPRQASKRCCSGILRPDMLHCFFGELHLRTLLFLKAYHKFLDWQTMHHFATFFFECHCYSVAVWYTGSSKRSLWCFQRSSNIQLWSLLPNGNLSTAIHYCSHIFKSFPVCQFFIFIAWLCHNIVQE